MEVSEGLDHTHCQNTKRPVCIFPQSWFSIFLSGANEFFRGFGALEKKLHEYYDH